MTKQKKKVKKNEYIYLIIIISLKKNQSDEKNVEIKEK